MRRLLALAFFLAPSLAVAAPIDEARRAFDEAIRAVNAGDLDAAILAFERAYAILPHPDVLYNIARAHADSGRLDQAIVYLDRYQADSIGPQDREQAQVLRANIVRRMERDTARLAAPAPEAAPAAAPLALPVDPGSVSSDTAAELLRIAATLQALAQGVDGAPAAEVEVAEAAPVLQVAVPVEEEPPLPPLKADDLLQSAYQRQVVTASRYSQDPLRAPSSITIVTAEDIRTSGATSLPQVLRQVPGIDVMELSAGNQELSIRGFNRRFSNKVVVLLDGRSVYQDFAGATIWAYIPVTLEEIERIEVVRGVGSALYGANAFAGVINIITRQPGSPEGQNAITGSLGDPEYWRGAIVLDGRDGNLAWRASAGTQHVARWANQANLEERPDLSTNVEDPDTALDVRTANAQVEWQFGPRGLVSAHAGISDGITDTVGPFALRDFWVDWRAALLRMDVAGGPFLVRSTFTRFDGAPGNWTWPTGGVNSESTLTNTLVGVEGSGDWVLGDEDQHRLTVGAGYTHKEIDWGFLDGPHAEDHFYGLLQGDAAFGPVVASAALRLDQHPLVGLTPSPRLAAIVRVDEGRALRVSGGTAFRTPTFMESYLSMYLPTATVDGVLVHSTGNPELEPEQILSGEVAYLEQATESFRGELVGYVSQINDLIDIGEVVPDVAPVFDEEHEHFIAGTTSFINEPIRYRIVGAEALGEYYGIDGLDVRLSYALERIWGADADGAGGFVAGEPVEATPLHKVHGDFTWRTPIDADLSMRLDWVSNTTWALRSYDADGNRVLDVGEVPSYFIITNRVAFRPAPGLELAASFWNWPALLPGVGPHREHPLGGPVGSRIFGDVTWRF